MITQPKLFADLLPIGKESILRACFSLMTRYAWCGHLIPELPEPLDSLATLMAVAGPDTEEWFKFSSGANGNSALWFFFIDSLTFNRDHARVSEVVST